MAVTKIKINRESLAKFIQDKQTIRQIELLIEIVNNLEIPEGETLEETIQRLIDASP